MNQPAPGPATAHVPAAHLPPAHAPGAVLRRTSALAVVSLVAGILCWVLVPVLGSLVAVVCGHLARAEIRRDRNLDGDGLAVAGLVLGYAQLVAIALVVVLALLFFGGILGLVTLGAGWS